jgi:hypothetical protein
MLLCFRCSSYWDLSQPTLSPLCTHQATSYKALSAALQHPAVTSDITAVCSLLQTCKSWRSAVQQCSAGHLSINTGSITSLRNPGQLSCFAAWLYFLERPKLLHALPAAALTRLELSHSVTWRQDPTADSKVHIQGLVRLTNLQHLHCDFFDAEPAWLRNGCLAAVGELPQLTKLYMRAVAPGSDFSLLPRQLQQLHVFIDFATDDCSEEFDEQNSRCSTPLALGYLSALQQLDLTGIAAAGSQLPTSLTGLTVCAAVPGTSSNSSSSSSSIIQHLNLTDLRQLQRIELAQAWLGREKLQALSVLTALTHLALGYGDVTDHHAVPEAPAWQHLSALKCMTLFQECMLPPRTAHAEDDDELASAASLSLLRSLAAATTLTCLELYGASVQPAQAWCSHLAGLQQLRHLVLVNQQPHDRADVIQLTALINLTLLRLEHESAAVDETAAAALAVRLTQLRELELRGVHMRSPAALPVIRALSGLTSFTMAAGPELSQQVLFSRNDLLLLTSLRQLWYLCLEDLFKHEDVGAVWEWLISYRVGRWRQQQ